jgi:UDP-N-acetylmuramoylalanine--D-glutamate ligase
MTKHRPSLPGGPYLVVGPRALGQAAALAAVESGAGCDSARRRGGGLGGAGVEVHSRRDGVGVCSEGVRCLVKSPGVPAEAPGAAAAPAGTPVLSGELELAWR